MKSPRKIKSLRGYCQCSSQCRITPLKHILQIVCVDVHEHSVTDLINTPGHNVLNCSVHLMFHISNHSLVNLRDCDKLEEESAVKVLSQMDTIQWDYIPN